DVVAAGGQVLQRLEHRLRLEPVAAVAVAERKLLPPGTQLCQPRLRRALAPELAHLVTELREDGLERPGDRHVRAAELVDLGGIDVEMDDRRARRESRELAGDAVVEACASRAGRRSPDTRSRARPPGRRAGRRPAPGRNGPCALRGTRPSSRAGSPPRPGRATSA